MTTPQVPTPPAGTRWREIEISNERFRFTNRLETWYNHRWIELHRVPASMVATFHDLVQNPTEPLPAPVVDRHSNLWIDAARCMDRAVGCRGAIGWRGLNNETDALLLALAPHWRELAALAGEKEPKVTALEGWYNIPSAQLSDHIMSKAPMFYQSKEDAQRASDKYPEGDFAHTAVRLAVVEDAG